MSVKGGTSQACAACKYQRRKCSADCPLAPYFPPDQPKHFQNAHSLFGVSNILKILNMIEPPQKAEAMRSILYEANIRERYPVHGCIGIIITLQSQIRQTQLELDECNANLKFYRQHHDLTSSSYSSPPLTTFLPLETISTDISLTDSNNSNNVNHLSWATQNSYTNGITNNSPYWFVAGSSPHVTAGEAEHDYNEICPYIDTIDEDRAVESSSDSSPKDSTPTEHAFLKMS